MTLNLVCRRCGAQGIPASFDDAASYHAFRQAREALWRPGNGHDAPVPAPAPDPREQRPARRGALTRGLFGLAGFVFLLAALGALGAAARDPGALPLGFVALLLSVPLLAVAARRPRP